MNTLNRLTGFVFESHVAHGAFVEISSGVGELLDHRAYSPDVARLVREVLVALPLLATHLRFEGRINLQFQGEGPIKLLVGQVDHHLQVRAMAKAPQDLAGGFADLLGGGVLALMIEPTSPGPAAPSQAIVPIRGERLSDALEAYFEQSEQLPTRIRIAVRGDRLAAFLLQRLPLLSLRDGEADWERLNILAATLGENELLDTEPLTLLRLLFAEDELRVLKPRPIEVRCRCSREGISRMLLSLGQDEVESLVAEQGQVEITCEFCGRQYLFSRHDAVGLFAAAGSEPAGTRH